jgi:hypothetical protein
MATQPPRTPTREEQRRLSIRTLLIASVASAAAAVVTSQFWIHGTWIAAAITPAIVSVVSEMLHRPTEAVARRVTTNRTAVMPRETEPDPGPAAVEDEMTVYGRGRSRAPSRSPSRRRKFAVGLVAATAVLGFAVAAVALTVPELITGQPIGNGNGGTTIFGGQKKSGEKKQTPDRQQTAPTGTQTNQRTTPTQTNQRTTPTQPTTPQQPKQQTTPSGQPPAQGQQPQR